MDNLFLLLMLASFVALITALINPLAFQKVFKDKATRKNLSIYFIGSTIIFFVFFGITTNPVEQITEVNTPTKINQKEQVILNLEQQNNQPQIQQEQEQPISNIEQQKDEVKPVEEQPKTANNEKPVETEKAEIIPTSDEEKIESPEETKVNTVQSPTPTKIEDELVPVVSETISQKNAVRKAKSYLGYSAFSHGGLIDQLKYEQFLQAMLFMVQIILMLIGIIKLSKKLNLI